MNTLLGIVIQDSFYLKRSKDLFIISLTILLDRKKFIFGEIKVHFKSPIPVTFKTGDRVSVTGEIIISSGFYFEAAAVIRLPSYF